MAMLRPGDLPEWMEPVLRAAEELTRSLSEASAPADREVLIARYLRENLPKVWKGMPIPPGAVYDTEPFETAICSLCFLAGANRAAVEAVATAIRSELEAAWFALMHAFYGRGEREPDLIFDEPAGVVRFCDDVQPSGRYPRRARWLQSIMEAAALSQARLARLAGVDRKAVRAILRGERVHKVTVERIIKALKQLPGFERLTEAAVPDD